MSFLHPQSAHNARLPRKVEFSSNATTKRDASPDKHESSDPNQFPMQGSAQIAGSRRKVPVGPGHSAMDWGRLKASGTNLRGGVTALQRYTPSELAQHNTVEDMWMAFQGKIYCCTQYLAYHPGGVGQLMRGAGKDATELFMKVHPWVNMDYIMGDKCLVGYLIPENMKQSTSLSAPQPKPVTNTSAKSSNSSSRSSSPIEFKIPVSRATKATVLNVNTATLTSTRQISSTISTFTFKLETPISHLPGSYAVFDFAGVLELPEYSHWKAQSRYPQKDDFTRTWTISSAPPISEKVMGTFDETTHVSCTIKRDGLMSSFLHSLEKGVSLKVPVTDVGGVFSCFDKNFATKPPPKKLLFVAGGVGVTPFLAMIEGLAARLQRDGSRADCDVSFMVSARGDDVRVLDGVSRDIVKRLFVFDSTAREDKFYNAGGVATGVESFARRIREDDLVGVEGLLERECFVCGPLEFMKDVKRWLFQAGVDPKRVHDESFLF
ncbi:hypothetical protein HDU77_006735 [Chytriomyces hyalinus]|nr:hypothetical protein HDU77_006735 [Chytriomyces hyalinus]